MNLEKLKEELQNLDNDSLISLFQEVNSYDGSFDFVDFNYIEDIALYEDSYNLARAIIYGNVTSVNTPVFYNAYGNLQTIELYEIENKCQENVNKLIEWLEDNSHNINLSNYIDIDYINEEEE